MSVRLPAKEYFYLREVFPDIDYYVLNASYTGNEVIIDFSDTKKDSFLTEYRSLIARIGLNDHQSYNETGVHLNNIFEKYLADDIFI